MGSLFKIVRVYKDGDRERYGSLSYMDGYIPLQEYSKDYLVEADVGMLFCFRTEQDARRFAVSCSQDVLDGHYELWEVHGDSPLKEGEDVSLLLRKMDITWRIRDELLIYEPDLAVRFWEDPEVFVEQNKEICWDSSIFNENSISVRRVRFIRQIPW